MIAQKAHPRPLIWSKVGGGISRRLRIDLVGVHHLHRGNRNIAEDHHPLNGRRPGRLQEGDIHPRLMISRIITLRKDRGGSTGDPLIVKLPCLRPRRCK